MRINRWIVIWVIVVVSLILIEIAQLAGIIQFTDLIANFFVFLIALVIIAVLAAVGAGFLGVMISHRIFSVREFTPFEEEMLKMREDLREVKESLKKLEERLKD